MTDMLPEIDPMAPKAPVGEPTVPSWVPPVGGLAAGAVAVAVGMLFAALLNTVSPIDAVGSEVIDRAPKWLKKLAIDWFGTNDKTALRAGIVILLAIAAAIFGRLACKRFNVGLAGFAAFAMIGLAAALHRPNQPGKAIIAPIVGAVAGIAVLSVIVRGRRIGGRRQQVEIPGRSRVPLGWDRRRFLAVTGTGAATAAVAYTVAKAIDTQRTNDVRDAARAAIPAAADTPVTTAAGTASADAGGGEIDPVTPFITPNGDYYRIDTALSFPRINVDSWKMKITGMVDKPLELTFSDLLARPQIERTITLCCVSNEVGGDLIGNAVFKGVRLDDLLKEAGVQPGAQQVYGISVDGWSCGFPVEVALDGRDAMIAISMNGESLPLEHGFPARVVVPGLYGYVSATKWLDEIKLTTWDDEQGYWVPRGWARDAPVKTESRIDVPRRGESVKAGKVAIAGIAWAQHRGVAKVEVGIDGVWAEARLSDDVSDDAWRQWVFEWEATTGAHVIQVRATDKTGATQTEEVARVDPDGATGWHTRKVSVSA